MNCNILDDGVNSELLMDYYRVDSHKHGGLARMACRGPRAADLSIVSGITGESGMSPRVLAVHVQHRHLLGRHGLDALRDSSSTGSLSSSIQSSSSPGRRRAKTEDIVLNYALSSTAARKDPMESRAPTPSDTMDERERVPPALASTSGLRPGAKAEGPMMAHVKSMHPY